MAVVPRFSYVFGAFRLDLVEKVLFQADKPVALTPKAIETLIVLVERHGHLVTKDELLRSVRSDPRHSGAPPPICRVTGRPE